jgi:hypothetical protein
MIVTKRKHPPRPQPTSTLTLHLGEESREHLTRCQQLLGDNGYDTAPLTLGAVVRLAVRRLLLGLLGERAHWDQPECPFAAEYLAVRSQQLREEFRTQRAAESRAGSPGPARPDDQGDGQKGGAKQ